MYCQWLLENKPKGEILNKETSGESLSTEVREGCCHLETHVLVLLIPSEAQKQMVLVVKI